MNNKIQLKKKFNSPDHYLLYLHLFLETKYIGEDLIFGWMSDS